MADIVESMFNVNPEQLRMQRFNQMQQQNMQMAQLDPFQRANAQIANAAGGAAMLGMQAIGLKTRDEQLAEGRQQIAAMVNKNEPDSYIAAAQKANRMGDSAAAMQLMQAGQALAKEQQAMSYQASQQKLAEKRTEEYDLEREELVKTGQLTEDGRLPIYTTKSGKQFILQNNANGVQQKVPYSGGVFVKPTGSSANPDVLPTQEEADFFARQMLSGDKSAVSGMARNKAAMAKIKSAMVRIAKEQNITPQQLAIINQEFVALGSSERVVGSQTANVQLAASEANKMADITLGLFDKIDNTEVRSLNDFKNMVGKQFGSEQVVSLNASLNALINAYARAINPRGVATVSDKEHARDMINSGFSKGQGGATIAIMKQEMQAALDAPRDVSAALRAKRLEETKDKEKTVSTGKVKFLGFE